MTIEYYHLIEKELEEKLRKFDPDNAALKRFYPTTQQAIESYRQAISDLFKNCKLVVTIHDE